MGDPTKTGFAALPPAVRRAIAARGGRAAHEQGTAHQWTSEEARVAGRKGGAISRGGRGKLVETPEPPAVIPAEEPAA